MRTTGEGVPLIVLPTYNERENLVALVSAIQSLPVPVQILVVDDNSPDGTGRLAGQLAAGSPNISVLHRPGKLGLGTAYSTGFEYGLAANADPILTMDADFSHDPCYIPALLSASALFDLVVGSRYIPGGGIRCWGQGRKALSWGANALAHGALGLRTRDCTSGFRCYRRRVLEAVDLSAIRANGYSYLIEMLYRVERMGFRVGETPIIFADRQLGRSKISRTEIWRAGLTVTRLAVGRMTGTGVPLHRNGIGEHAAR